MTLIEAAYKAGRALYGNDLIFSAKDINKVSFVERVKQDIENMGDYEFCGQFDEFEYIFDLEGNGTEAAGDKIVKHLLGKGRVLVYDPHMGISIIEWR